MVAHRSGYTLRCCCSEPKDGGDPQLLTDYLRKSQVGRPEVVRPVRDTMRLVDANKSNWRKVGEERSKGAASTCNCLGRDEKKMQPARLHLKRINMKKVFIVLRSAPDVQLCLSEPESCCSAVLRL